ncbi:MAG: amidohydrolase family protein, partial [Ideonella sp.]|nr:amidohydrolase family protein [Ideonella sp.]
MSTAHSNPADLATPASPFDLLIAGGTVIDGTKAPRFDADVGITAGRIVAIGDLAGHAALQTLDASGRIVAPGFIDSHTHDDHALLAQPAMAFKVSQGVTTVVTGNCGISMAPLRPGGPLPAPLNLLDVAAHAPFETFAAFLQALRDAPAAVNVVPMVGHTTLRVTAMADLQRSATADEIATMRSLLQEALDAGAVGLSTGTFYPPAAAASTEEIIGLGRALTGSGALYATHLRDEADEVMSAMDEAFRIGRELDVPVVLSHH